MKFKNPDSIELLKSVPTLFPPSLLKVLIFFDFNSTHLRTFSSVFIKLVT